MHGCACWCIGSSSSTHRVGDLEVDRLARLDADDQLIGGQVDVGAKLVGEDVAWYMPALSGICWVRSPTALGG